MSNVATAVDPVLTMPAVINLAKHYELAPEYFVNTVRTVAMPNGHTTGELVQCLLVAREHGLNPLTKEIYFMKTRGGGIQPIVSVDGWARKCNEHPAFDGMDFEYDIDKDGKPVSVTCIIYRKDRKHPIKATEFLDECEKGAGNVWKTHPKRMLRHRALTQAARYAFGFAGVMDRDEFDQWQQAKNEAQPVKLRVVQELPDIPDVPDIPDAVDDIPPDDVPVVFDPRAFVDSYRNDMTLMPADERQEYFDSNEASIEMLPADMQEEIDAINRELMP